MDSFFFVPFAAIASELVTSPIDTLRVNKQVFSQSSFSIIKYIYKKDGIRGFYRSLPPAIGRHMIYTTLRVNLYEKTRNKNDNILKKLLCASSVSAFSQLIASPNDYIRIQLQTKRNYRLSTCIFDIYKNKGVIGFWYGWKPNISRAAIVSAGTLVSYDASKIYYKKKFENNQIIQLASSTTSGIIAGILSNPVDTVKSLIMSNKYKDLNSCILFFKKNGIFSLYRGFPYQCLRITVWQICFWSTLENIRILFDKEEFA